MKPVAYGVFNKHGELVSFGPTESSIEGEGDYIAPLFREYDTDTRLVKAENEASEYREIAARKSNQVAAMIRDARVLEAENERLRKALEPFASVAELFEVDTEGFSETDILDLTFNDYHFERFTLSQFQAARRARGGRER